MSNDGEIENDGGDSDNDNFDNDGPASHHHTLPDLAAASMAAPRATALQASSAQGFPMQFGEQGAMDPAALSMLAAAANQGLLVLPPHLSYNAAPPTHAEFARHLKQLQQLQAHTMAFMPQVSTSSASAQPTTSATTVTAGADAQPATKRAKSEASAASKKLQRRTPSRRSAAAGGASNSARRRKRAGSSNSKSGNSGNSGTAVASLPQLSPSSSPQLSRSTTATTTATSSKPTAAANGSAPKGRGGATSSTSSSGGGGAAAGGGGGRKVDDAYRVKRQRNNEAVRKCRIKKKLEMEAKEKQLEQYKKRACTLVPAICLCPCMRLLPCFLACRGGAGICLQGLQYETFNHNAHNNDPSLAPLTQHPSSSCRF